MIADESGERDFRHDLVVSRNCDNPCCRRVANHASQLVRAGVLLKSLLIQQSHQQDSHGSQQQYGNINRTVSFSRSDYAALQRQVEAGLGYQREVQQLRREIEFQRETIENYRKLINDGNAFRDELRNELNLARKSASIARANLEEERRNQNRTSVPVNPPISTDTDRWLEVYKHENTKLRESVRVLTEKEMNLASTVGRIKDHVEEEVERLIQSKGHKLERTYFGPWFMGLVGLLGVPCPSTLEYYLTTPSSPPSHSSTITKNDRQTRRCSHSLTHEERTSATFQNILNDLEEVMPSKESNQAPPVKKLKDQKKRKPSTQTSISRKRSRYEMTKTTRGERRRLSQSSSSDSSIVDDAPVSKRPKRKRREEVAVSESRSSAVNTPKKSSTSPASLNLGVTSSSKPVVEQLKRMLRLSESATESDFEDVLPSMQRDSVDLDEVEPSLAPANATSPIAQRVRGGLPPIDAFFSNLDEDSPDEIEPEPNKSHLADSGGSRQRNKSSSAQNSGENKSTENAIVSGSAASRDKKSPSDPNPKLQISSPREKIAENSESTSKSNGSVSFENAKVEVTSAFPQSPPGGISGLATVESEACNSTSPVKSPTKDSSQSLIFGSSDSSIQPISSEGNKSNEAQNAVVSGSPAEIVANDTSMAELLEISKSSSSLPVSSEGSNSKEISPVASSDRGKKKVASQTEILETSDSSFSSSPSKGSRSKRIRLDENKSPAKNTTLRSRKGKLLASSGLTKPSEINKSEKAMPELSAKRVLEIPRRILTPKVQSQKPIPNLSSRTDFASTDRIQTRPMGIRRKKPATLPMSLEDIVTRKFSKLIFKWFDALTTYQSGGVSKEPTDIPSLQISEPFNSLLKPNSQEGTSTFKSVSPLFEEPKSAEEVDNQITISSPFSSPSLPQLFVSKTPEKPAPHARINPASPNYLPLPQTTGFKVPEKPASNIQNSPSSPKLPEQSDNRLNSSPAVSKSTGPRSPKKPVPHIQNGPSSPKLLEQSDNQLNASPPASKSTGAKSPEKPAPNIHNNGPSSPKLLEQSDNQLNSSPVVSKSNGPKSPEKPEPFRCSDVELSRSCLPLGSCVAVESGIITSSQPHSLFENLLDYFVGKQPTPPLTSSPNLTMDIVCDAVTESLEILLKSNPNLPLFPPPVCAVRAATLLKSINKGSDISAFNSWFRVRTHASKKKARCPPKSPMLLFRLAQTSFLTCDLSKREDLLYQLSTFLAFSGYDSAPITCLLLAFQSNPSSASSSLASVYQFLAWKEREQCLESNEFVAALRQVSFYSDSPSVILLREFISSLVNEFCYGKKGQEDTPENREDIARALRLVFTFHAFTELDVKKSAANRFGLAGWLLKVRLLNWINSLEKGVEMCEATSKLLLRICSLTVDIILLTTQLDMQMNPSKITAKVLSPCQRGLTYCSDKIFEVLISIPKTFPEHIPCIVVCLLRLAPCLSEQQLSTLRDVLIDLSKGHLLNHEPLNLPSILPPLQNAFVNHALERLKLSSNRPIVQVLKKLLNLNL
nr:hypothetical transcript [Hymenolepis microstoma]